MNPKAILLDLDGTLVDTAPDFALAIEALRDRRNLPPLPLSQVRSYCSWGARRLARLALDLPEEDEQVTAELLQLYTEVNGRQSRLFAEAEDFIRACEQHALLWGIATNKPRRFGEPLLRQLLGDRQPPTLYPEDVERAKPAPDLLLRTAEILQLNPQECCYVGDHSRDYAAAQAADMPFITAGWGYLDNDDVWPPEAFTHRADCLSSVIPIALNLP